MKRVISVLLSVAMVFSMLVAAIPASAAETVLGNDTQKVSNTGAEKKATVSTNHVPADFDGDGETDAGAIAINSVGGIRGIEGGKKYYLTSDIVIKTGQDNVTAGSPVKSWTGADGFYFDGCGFTVEFDKTAGTNPTATSLFDGGTATIYVKNLNVTGVINSPNEHAQHVSALAQAGGGAVVENVVSDVDITVNNLNGNLAVGGVWSKLDGGTTSKFDNVHFTGSITMTSKVAAGTYTGVGGIYGFSSRKVEMIDCSNSGDITVGLSVDDHNHGGIGGLIGVHNGSNNTAVSFTAKNCVNSGKITVYHVDSTKALVNVHVGAIAGKMYQSLNVNIEDCANNGAISYASAASSGWGTAGGILGTFITITNTGSEPSTLQIKNCVNNAAITGVGGVAGILGAAKQFNHAGTGTGAINLNVLGCKNFGAIMATGVQNDGGVASGGIIGDVSAEGNDSTMKLTVSDCFNIGAVVAKGWNVGGIIGRFYWPKVANAATVERCVNTGSVKLDRAAYKEDPWLCSAGIVGHANGGSKIAINNCINTGAISTAEETGLSTYPITNCVNTVVSGGTVTTDLSYITGSGNVYTADSVKRSDAAYTKYGTADTLANIITKINGFTNYSAADKAAIKSALNANYDALYKAYEAAVAYKATLNETAYTEATWKAFDDAIAAAAELLNSAALPADAAMNTAKTNIETAKAALALVNFTALDQAIADAEAITDESAYTTESWKLLGDALAAAKDKKTSRDQGDIDAAAKALADAIDALVAPNYDALNNAIAAYEALTETEWTTDSWATLATPLANAETAKTSRTQADIDAAAKALADAIDALVAPDYSALNSAITAAEALNANDYSEDDWTAISEALDAARLAQSSRVQADIDAAAEALNAVIAEKDKLDRTALVEALEAVKSLDENTYSVESWTEFMTVVESVTETLDTSRVQADIDAAVTALAEAQGKLVAPDYTTLNEAIAGYEALTEDDWTTESWATLATPLANANEALTSRTQADIEAAAEALADAIDALKAPNYDALNEAIAEYEALTDTEWTTDSWNVVVAALADANEAFNSRTQADINAAAEALDAAIKALVAPNYDALNEAIAEYEALTETDWTIDSWATLATPLANAETAKTSRTQADIDAAAKALADAIDALIKPDYTELNNAINVAENCTMSDEATEEQKANFNTCLENAKAALNSRTQADIDAAVKALNEAIDKVAGISRAALSEAIAKAEALNENDYTVEDWEAIQTVLSTAKDTLDSSMDQVEINAAEKALTDLIEGENAKTPLDRNAINNAISNAEALDENAYTTETWATVTDALAIAKEKVGSRVQTEIDDAAKALADAIDALKAPDYAAINGAIGIYNSLTETEWTTESWATLATPLANATEALTSRTQADIDAAAEALDAAIKALVAPDYTALDEIIASADGLTEDEWSIDSWAAVVAALADAETAKTSRTQADIDAAAKALADAIAALAAPDYTALNEAIANAEALAETDYTVEDWAEILEAIETAKTFLENRKQADIDAAVAALTEAIGGKTKLDRTALKDMIDATDSIEESDYEPEDWAALQAAIEAAKTALDARTQQELDDALAALVEAIKKTSIDYSALEEALEEAGKLNENDYSAEDWAAILDAIAKAEEALEAIIQAEVDEALATLNDVISGTPKLDNTALKGAIEEAGKLTETDYAAEDWTAILEAIAKAEAALTARTQKELDDALAALNEAINSKVKLDRTALEDALNAYFPEKDDEDTDDSEESVALIETDYTVEDWEAILAAVNAAKTALTARTQKEIDDALAALNEVINSKTKLDRTELNGLIQSAGSLLNETDYTAESWAAFKTALEAAKAAAAKRTQAEINAGKSLLDKAIAELVEAPATPDEQPEETPDDTKPVDKSLDFSALEEAIAKAEKLKASDYNETSWTKLEAAVVTAKKTLTSAKSQAEIDAAIVALEAAVKALSNDPDADKNDGADSSDKADAPTNAKDKIKKGCKSAIAASAVVLTTVFALGLGFKKKED